MNNEFFSQFILFKFELIQLENNIFDFVEKHLFEECENCNKISNDCFICLICGKKICHIPDVCLDVKFHPISCIGQFCILIDFRTTRLYCLKANLLKKFFYLYTNDSGAGPDKNITNEYHLNKEKVKLALRDYICLDYN